jgi:hypothetical protein
MIQNFNYLTAYMSTSGCGDFTPSGQIRRARNHATPSDNTPHNEIIFQSCTFSMAKNKSADLRSGALKPGDDVMMA